MSRNAVIAVTPVRPSPTPKIAVRIGMPAATSEPKVSTSTTSARPMPMSSAARPAARSRPCPGRSPRPQAGVARASSRASEHGVLRGRRRRRLTVSTSKAKVMTPIRPSSVTGAKRGGGALGGRALERVHRVHGRLALGGRAARPAPAGRRARSATRSATAAAYGAWSSRSPSGAATTTLTVASSKASLDVGEQLGLQVGGLLRRDAGDAHLVAGGLRERGGERADRDEQHDPAGEERRPAAEGGAAEAVQVGGHEVGGLRSRWRSGWRSGAEQGAGGEQASSKWCTNVAPSRVDEELLERGVEHRGEQRDGDPAPVGLSKVASSRATMWLDHDGADVVVAARAPGR